MWASGNILHGMRRFAEQHRTVGFRWRQNDGYVITRPSPLLAVVRELDASVFLPADMPRPVERQEGRLRYYAIDGKSLVVVDAEWADVFLAHGLIPWTFSSMQAVRWCDSKGQRVGYQMPVRQS
jgi:hypothetical protein